MIMCEEAERNKLPNIIFILSDDQGPWAMRCAGNSEIETPNLDRLAESGMRFDNFFCASPVCSPARATLMTGLIPSRHGIHDYLAAGSTISKYESDRDGILIEYLARFPAYTDCLAAAGYRCGIIGKWHLGDSHHRQKSFELWEVHAKGGGPYYNAPMIKDGEVYEEPRYVTDVITDNALDWLDNCLKDPRPFYLSVNYTAPHSPWDRNNHPRATFDRYYSDCPFQSTPDGLAPPEWVKRLNIQVEDADKRREYLSGYFAAVTEMDRNIGRLLHWLDINGLRNDTLVIFGGDNGMNMGHHGVYGKGNGTWPMNMFDESVKVPFMVSRPGSIGAGVCHELISQYDFMPTLLDYLGIADRRDGTPPGRSFADILRGRNSSASEHVVVFDEYGPVRMVRNRDYKYIHRFSCGPNELYNLKDDPREENNLAGLPNVKALEDEMRERLREWFARYVHPDRDGSRLPVCGFGQVGLSDISLGGEANFRRPDWLK